MNMNTDTKPIGSDDLEAVQYLASSAAQFAQAASGSLTDQLAVCLAANLAASWQRLSASQSGSPDPLQRVRLLSPFLALLRRGDHAAQRLQIRRDCLNFACQRHQDRFAGHKSKYDEILNPRSDDDGAVTKETIAKIAEDLNLF